MYFDVKSFYINKKKINFVNILKRIKIDKNI